jgi:MscS family membrane protein
MSTRYSKCAAVWWLATGVVVLACAITSAGAADQPLDVALRASINPGLGATPPEVDRTTAAAAWRSFLKLGASGQFSAAAHLLDLTEVPTDQQKAVGREIARKLWAVLERVGAQTAALPEIPQQPTTSASARNVVVALHFQHGRTTGEVWLRRTRDEQSGEVAWLFTRLTVSSVRSWYQSIVEGRAADATEVLDVGLGPPPPSVKRGTPRQAVSGFLAAARQGEFELAAHYLDLNAIPAAQQRAEGARFARRLMLVIQRTVRLNPARLSNDPAGAPEAGIPEDEQRLATLRVHGEDVDISLARHRLPEAGTAWTLSADTVGQIDRLYDAHGYGWIGDHLPTFFFAASILGLQLWQWAGLVLMLVLGWAVSRIVGRLAVRAAGGIASRTAVTWDDQIVSALDGPLGFMLWGLVLAGLSPLLGLSPATQEIARRLWRLLIIAGFGWLLFRTVDSVTRHMREVAVQRNALALSFIPLVQRLGKVCVVVLLLLAGLDVIGVNVVAALAGVGLGGLAVAFAAQKTLENVFGALAIAGDRPFRVGDFVTIGDVTGTVEDVGLRSTKVRTLQRTLVTIPNSTVVNGNVTNFAARDRIFLNFTVGLVYGTTLAQITYVLDEIRRLLLEDPRVYLDAQRSRFKGFGASSLDIEVFSWILTTDYTTYTVIAEELYLKIMEIVERSGTSFAFPSQTLYLARDGGIDAAKADEAAREVERRRQGAELVVPEPSEQQLEQAREERQRRLGGSGT